MNRLFIYNNKKAFYLGELLRFDNRTTSNLKIFSYNNPENFILISVPSRDSELITELYQSIISAIIDHNETFDIEYEISEIKLDKVQKGVR